MNLSSKDELKGIHVNRDILNDITGSGKAENTGEDNLETTWRCLLRCCQ